MALDDIEVKDYEKIVKPSEKSDRNSIKVKPSSKENIERKIEELYLEAIKHIKDTYNNYKDLNELDKMEEKVLDYAKKITDLETQENLTILPRETNSYLHNDTRAIRLKDKMIKNVFANCAGIYGIIDNRFDEKNNTIDIEKISDENKAEVSENVEKAITEEEKPLDVKGFESFFEESMKEMEEKEKMNKMTEAVVEGSKDQENNEKVTMPISNLFAEKEEPISVDDIDESIRGYIDKQEQDVKEKETIEPVVEIPPVKEERIEPVVEIPTVKEEQIRDEVIPVTEISKEEKEEVKEEEKVEEKPVARRAIISERIKAVLEENRRKEEDISYIEVEKEKALEEEQQKLNYNAKLQSDIQEMQQKIIAKEEAKGKELDAKCSELKGDVLSINARNSKLDSDNEELYSQFVELQQMLDEKDEAEFMEEIQKTM
ncbi:MAG: hypothetical protein IJ097_03350 [Bacilli bacterium]|nr:hypothetical protein [Bacilli bacterium]